MSPTNGAAGGHRLPSTEAPSIRPARDEDAPTIAALWTEAYVAPGTGGRSEPYREEDYRHSARDGAVLVAERQDGVAGVVVLLTGASPAARIATEHEAEVSRLAVSEHARRRGVGAALMSACRDRAVKDGCDGVVLWTRPAQEAAQRLYRGLGYERDPARDTSDPYGPCLVYRLALPERS